MPVIPLTITVSLCLVFTFVVFFIRENSRRFSNAERESLLPLNEETPRLAGSAARGHPEHDADDDACGCRLAERDPCTGCLKRSTPSVGR